MSLNRIKGLVGDAQQLLADAQTEPDPARVRKLHAAAKQLFAEADEVAEKTKPGVAHPVHGYAVVVGVDPEGYLELFVDGGRANVAVLVDDVEAAS